MLPSASNQDLMLLCSAPHLSLAKGIAALWYINHRVGIIGGLGEREIREPLVSQIVVVGIVLVVESCLCARIRAKACGSVDRYYLVSIWIARF
jgi:hypothetical protein